ncbi:DUF2207 domain-containing protein [Lachnospiraceae bacterium 54-53]
MKPTQKRLLIFSALLSLLFILGSVPVFAAEEAIPSIGIEAELQSDGSAVITETWEVRGVSSGTEYYKALDNMDGMSVHSLRVWDESGTQYKTLDSWNTDLSREEKSGTCGIIKKSDGYELCWGIGSYGDHIYTIQYTIDGLVKDYGDYAGFYHQFVSELSSAPESVSIKLQMADTYLTADNARIWGYGFTGDVEIQNNGLSVLSSEALDDGDYVNVLCRFDRSLFPLAPKSDMSFGKLQKSAENDNSNLFLSIFVVIFLACIIIGVILALFLSSRYKLADGTTVRLPGRKQTVKNWAIPFDGGIPAVYAAMGLLRKGIPCEKLMGAYLIRWQEAGSIRMEQRESVSNRKNAKKEDVIVFLPEKRPDQEPDKTLYELLAGNADDGGILWISDLEKRSERLHEKLTAWAAEVKGAGEKTLIQLNAAAADTKGVIRFTSSGFEQASRVLGLRNYLMEMQKQGEDGASRKELWGDYLVFASLFGIGEQVLKSMKALDPDYYDTFSGRYGYNTYSMMYLMTVTNHISSASVPDTSGTGGSASSFGGGGFSGGGGGGSR